MNIQLLHLCTGSGRDLAALFQIRPKKGNIGSLVETGTPKVYLRGAVVQPIHRALQQEPAVAQLVDVNLQAARSKE